MRKKITKRQTELSLPIKNIIGIAVSCIFGTIITLLVSFIFSFILSRSPELSKFVGLYFITSVVIGGLICGLISTKFLSFKGLISGLISGIPFSFFIFIIMLVFSQGRLNLYSVILLLIILISTIIGGIIGANTKRRK